jgi:hypothetical protein
MSEPLDPITAGVASALKSLRTRAGLREDRLAGAELPLDTLAGLESVRERVAAGEPVEQAIVRAVKAAARTLEPPTYSIVADVSLCLELSKEAMRDTGLYARDLGVRRAALLENWDQLHTLRSVADPGRVPAPRALRLDIETAALAALAAALTEPDRQRGYSDPLGAAATPAAGTLPLPERAIRDGSGETPALGAEQSLRPGAAGTAVGQVGQDTGGPPPLPRLVRAQAPLLLEEFRRVSQALRDSLLVGGEGTGGWPHDLKKGSKPATPLATAFGLKTMLLLEGFLAPDLIPVAEQLRNSDRSGGYAARVQKEPRPEVTAAVLGTLHRIDGTVKFDKQVAALKKNFGDFERTRPFVITTVLETSVQLNTDPRLTRSLVKDLLAARQSYGNLLLWPEKAEKDRRAPVPSIAHTARAVRALAQFQIAMPAARLPDSLDVEAQQAVDQAAAWLAEQQDLGNATEIIDRQLDDGVEQVYVRHFTPAWVVKALVSAGLPASDPSVSSAVTRIWQQYNREAALWTWRNGDRPVWMTLDAVEALRLAALAATIPPGGFAAL